MSKPGAWWNRDHSLEVDIVARTAENIATVGTIKWRPRGGVTRTEMAELASARNVVPDAGGARLLALCPSGLVLRCQRRHRSASRGPAGRMGCLYALRPKKPRAPPNAPHGSRVKPLSICARRG
jgi:hypothetical protein